jgi:hypothetical protein
MGTCAGPRGGFQAPICRAVVMSLFFLHVMYLQAPDGVFFRALPVARSAMLKQGARLSAFTFLRTDRCVHSFGYHDAAWRKLPMPLACYTA